MRVLGYAIALSLATGVLFGLAPARMLVARPDIAGLVSPHDVGTERMALSRVIDCRKRCAVRAAARRIRPAGSQLRAPVGR